MIQLLLIGEELSHSIQSVVEDVEMLLGLGTGINVVDSRKRRQLVVAQSGLEEFPVESLSVVCDHAIGLGKDRIDGFADLQIIIHINFPLREIPGVDAVDLLLAIDLPASTDDRGN